MRAWIFAKVAGDAFLQGIGVLYRIIGYIVAALSGLSEADAQNKVKYGKMIALLQSAQRFIEAIAKVFQIDLGNMVATLSGWDADSLGPMLDHMTTRLKDGE